MTKFGKWLGGGLGWALGGPIGAIIGFAIGSVMDDTKVVARSVGVKQSSTKNDFATSLLVLVAAVVNADNKVLKSEIDYVKKFYLKYFGEEQTIELMMMLREILKQNIPVPEVCHQIKANMDYSSRLQLIHFLFGIANCDHHISDAELRIIEQISINMGIRNPDYLSVKNMFIRNTDSDFLILEISPEATNEEVKKAYRKMAVKFHPDKVAHLGTEYQQSAKEKFQKVQDAYENIKKQRNFS